MPGHGRSVDHRRSPETTFVEPVDRRPAAQFAAADNMTDSLAALGAMVGQGTDGAEQALHVFRERWREDLLKVIPELEQAPGSYAENYGRAISFFLDLHYATGDEPGLKDRDWLAQQWESARTLASSGSAAVLVLDEIQKIPDWSETASQ